MADVIVDEHGVYHYNAGRYIFKHLKYILKVRQFSPKMYSDNGKGIIRAGNGQSVCLF